jgi:hypothetical protein
LGNPRQKAALLTERGFFMGGFFEKRIRIVRPSTIWSAAIHRRLVRRNSFRRSREIGSNVILQRAVAGE